MEEACIAIIVALATDNANESKNKDYGQKNGF